VINPEIWETRLHKDGILNLFDIPHFGRINEIHSYINMLLICVHEGYLWLDRLVSIDIDLIMHITGLPLQGEDPSLLFSNKKNEKALSESMKENFNTQRVQCDLDVARICNLTMRFMTQVLACKLLRKLQKDQFPTTVIEVIEKCIEGVQMNWVTFLLNQFLIDYEETQYQGTDFHYA
jgi:hypothetical protein